MIPTGMVTQAAMLASPCSTPAQTCVELNDTGKWVFDLKFDGVRCLAYVDEGTVTLRNRRGKSITRKYPEVAAALANRYRDQTLVLDGELVALHPVDGKPDFARIAKREHLTHPMKIVAAARVFPVTYMAFDVLWSGGTDMRRQPLTDRLELLASLVPPVEHVIVASMSSTDGVMMWAFAEEHQLEGLVAKRADSPYIGRRDPAWVKLKRNQRITALVTGYVPGEGGHAGLVGALIVSLINEHGDLVEVGKVGTGFKAADHAPLIAALQSGQEFLVEVEFLEFTEQGRLRMPSFKGVRSDVDRSAASLSQIGPS
jgi:bifunctional non-homologous end joining protein LigD